MELQNGSENASAWNHVSHVPESMPSKQWKERLELELGELEEDVWFKSGS